MSGLIVGAAPLGYDPVAPAVRDRRLRQFIRRQYRETFAADIRVSYPNLLGLVGRNGDILSAIGYRDGQRKLFVEHYLDKPLDQWMFESYNRKIPREHIVELGNLASTSTRHTIALMQQAWHLLQKQGYHYIAYTGTQSVLRLFKSLPYRIVTHADPVLVPGDCQWGTYYSHKPVVLCAQLRDYDQRFGFGTLRPHHSICHLRDGERVL